MAELKDRKPRLSENTKSVIKISVAGFFALVSIAIIAISAYVLSIVGSWNSVVLPEDLGQSTVIDTSKDITNIALFGVDQRNGEQCRSDCIMILSVDKEHDKIKIASVMRDSYVEIDGRGKDKLAHAYFFGGPVLAIKTLNKNFELNISEYMTVNFEELATIIDALGGITIDDLSEAERKDANKSVKEQAKAQKVEPQYIEKSGENIHLTGMQAVAYSRIRNVGNSDFERTYRQRAVLEKIFEKGKAMEFSKYGEFAKKFLPIVETSLDYEEVMKLATIMQRDVSFVQTRFPNNKDLINGGSLIANGIWYLNFDIDRTVERIHAFIYDDADPNEFVPETPLPKPPASSAPPSTPPADEPDDTPDTPSQDSSETPDTPDLPFWPDTPDETPDDDPPDQDVTSDPPIQDPPDQQ